MPRKIGYAYFSPAQKAALRKAQLESARKRRKHHADNRSSRKRALKIAGAVAVGAALAGGAGYVAHSKLTEKKVYTNEKPLSFNVKDKKGKAEAIKFGRSITKQRREFWAQTPDGEKQFNAIRSYTSAAENFLISKAARGHSFPEWASDSSMEKWADETLKNLDAAFDSENVNPMLDWTHVSRGASLRDFEHDDPWVNAAIKKAHIFTVQSGGISDENLSILQEQMIGKTFENQSYTSTSLGETPAFTSSPVYINFSLPPGTRAIYVADDMKEGENDDKDALTSLKGEREIILRRKLKYTVKKVSKDKNGKIIIDVEAHPHG